MAIRSTTSARRAFTIAELMIVLIILGVVLAVVLPSLKATNTAAKKAATTTIMVGLSGAAIQFASDHNGQRPGYFSAAEMHSGSTVAGGGGAGNSDRGFSGLQNVLLDLMPGITSESTSTGDQNILQVGPTAGNLVSVSLRQLGSSVQGDASSSTRAYFRADPKLYYSYVVSGAIADAPSYRRKQQAVSEHIVLPSLHDSFGQPILAWESDERVHDPATFAADNTTSGPATFCLSNNACFLRATGLGRLERNQNQGAVGTDCSLLSLSDQRFSVDALRSLLSNPAAAGRVRGSLVFHSAGANGIYLGSDERGAKIAQGSSGALVGSFGQTGVDPVKNGDFDDVVISGGN